MTVCIDTNVVLGMFGHAMPHLPLRQALFAGKLIWAVSTEILLEYEEIVAREMGVLEAEKMLRFIEIVRLTRGGVRFVSPDFRFRAITFDADDDKFADCAITAHADYVITQDKHFQPLEGAGYKPRPVTPEEFIRRHLGGA